MRLGDRESEAQYGHDYTQPRPTDMEVAQMFSELDVKDLEPNRDFLLYIQQISKSFPGVFQVELFNFQIGTNQYLDWFGSRNRLGEINFFLNFLNHKDVIRSLKKKGVEPSDKYVFQNPIESIAGFSFDTDLAALEYFGGAYHEYETSDLFKCRENAFEFWKKFTEGRLLDFTILHTREPWSDWFSTIHDETYLIYDKLKRQVSLLVIEDSD